MAETWLTKTDHVPGTMWQSFCICRRDRNNEYKRDGIAIRIREEINHVESQVK